MLTLVRAERLKIDPQEQWRDPLPHEEIPVIVQGVTDLLQSAGSSKLLRELQLRVQLRLIAGLVLSIRVTSHRAMRSGSRQLVMKREASLLVHEVKLHQVGASLLHQPEVKHRPAVKRQVVVRRRPVAVNLRPVVNRDPKLHRVLHARITMNHLRESNVRKRLARSRQDPKLLRGPNRRVPSLRVPKHLVLNQRDQNLRDQKHRGQNPPDRKPDRNRRDRVLTRQVLHASPTTTFSFGV